MSEDPDRTQDAADDERAMREHEREAREREPEERTPEDRGPANTASEAADLH